MKNILTLVILGFMATACSSGDKLDCQKKSASKLGFEDGERGLSEDNGLEVKRTCEKKDVTISLADYKSGWIRGIQKYCSPKYAFKLGKEGKDKKAYENCPVEMKDSFAANYKRGLKFAELNDEIEDYEKDLKKLEKKKVKLEETVAKIEETNQKLDAINQEIGEVQAKKERISETVRKVNADGGGLEYIILD